MGGTCEDNPSFLVKPRALEGASSGGNGSGLAADEPGRTLTRCLRIESSSVNGKLLGYFKPSQRGFEEPGPCGPCSGSTASAQPADRPMPWPSSGVSFSCRLRDTTTTLLTASSRNGTTYGAVAALQERSRTGGSFSERGHARLGKARACELGKDVSSDGAERVGLATSWGNRRSGGQGFFLRGGAGLAQRPRLRFRIEAVAYGLEPVTQLA